MYFDFVTTPIGTLEIKASPLGVTNAIFSDLIQDTQPILRSKITDSCKQQLEEYFLGQRKTFNFALDLQGTSFQKSVWACLLKIPFGQAASYQDIANMLGNPKAVRAVGAANGKNPIGIIVPCHRIIGSNGTLTGYAGGLDRKSWLLKYEGIDFEQEKNKASNCLQGHLFN